MEEMGRGKPSFVCRAGSGWAPFLREVVEKLRSDTSSPIVLVTECDTICSSCPHSRGKCVREEGSDCAKFNI
jgi:hypothetical protein